MSKMAGTKRPSDVGDSKSSKKAKVAQGSSKVPSLGPAEDDFVPFGAGKDDKIAKQRFGKGNEGHGATNNKFPKTSEPYLGGKILSHSCATTPASLTNPCTRHNRKQLS